MGEKTLVRYSMHEDQPLVIKDSDVHLNKTIENSNVFEVESTVVDDEDNGRWHEELVFAEDEDQAEKMYTRACEEFAYDVVGNLDIVEQEEAPTPA
jgi:hypothetical protein